MIDAHQQIVTALSAILPTHYEMQVSSGTATPCITYMESGNSAEQTGDTVGYSRIVYTVKVWADSISVLQTNAALIDKAMRNIGFKRTGSNELFDPSSTMKQKVLTFEALASENFD